jgi:hypothetical protein
MVGPDIDTALDWRGRTVRDADGEKIGSLGDVYLDQETDRPAWGGVRTGLFGRGESLIPLDRVTPADDGDLHVPFPRDLVKDAPRVDPDVALDHDEEARLFAHYDGDPAATGGTGASGGSHAAGAPGHDVDRPDGDAERPGADGPRGDGDDRRSGGDSAAIHGEPDGRVEADDRRHADARADDGSMVRSEEEVVVKDGPMRPAERVRLKKVLVTDEVQKTVPVRREVVQLEHEPPPAGTVESVEDVDGPAPDGR